MFALAQEDVQALRGRLEVDKEDPEDPTKDDSDPCLSLAFVPEGKRAKH